MGRIKAYEIRVCVDLSSIRCHSAEWNSDAFVVS